MVHEVRLAALPGAVAPIDAGTPYLLAGFLLLLLVAFGTLWWRRSARWRREIDKLRATLDAAGAPILVTDGELTIVDANAAATRLLGLRKRGLRRVGLLDHLKLEGEGRGDRLREALHRTGACDFEASAPADPSRTSSRVYLRGRLRSMDVAGAVRVVALLEDITPERELSAHYERFLDHLIENVPLEVAILSIEGKYRYLSSSFLVDERQREWLIGRTDFDYCQESGLHTEIALRRRAHRMEAVDRSETVFFEEDVVLNGRRRRLAWRYVPFLDEDGEVMMIVGFGQDQTDLVDCRDELSEARATSEKAARLKEALLRNVSHEVRTPISGIIGTAQMLKGEVDPALRDFMESIEENGERLFETLSGMLDLAGLQAENLELQPVMVDVSAEVEDVVRSCRTASDRRGLFLEFSAAEPEILVRVDRDGLARSIKGLVDNALKFTKEGGVAVDVSQRDGSAYIRVMDTGVGIGSSLHGDVFEAFSQEDDGLDRSFEGSGVGLAVIEGFVRRMGGEVNVHSRKGAGSSFVVRLPLVMPTLRKAGGRRPRVLIADPQRDAHRLVTHLMQGLFAFDSAYDVEDLDGAERAGAYDVALVDARLFPDRSERAILELFRGMQATSRARLVFVDCDPRTVRRRRVLEEGWDAYVEKPITKLALLNALHDEEAEAVAAGTGSFPG